MDLIHSVVSLCGMRRVRTLRVVSARAAVAMAPAILEKMHVPALKTAWEIVVEMRSVDQRRAAIPVLLIAAIVKVLAVLPTAARDVSTLQ